MFSHRTGTNTDHVGYPDLVPRGWGQSVSLREASPKPVACALALWVRKKDPSVQFPFHLGRGRATRHIGHAAMPPRRRSVRVCPWVSRRLCRGESETPETHGKGGGCHRFREALESGGRCVFSLGWGSGESGTEGNDERAQSLSAAPSLTVVVCGFTRGMSRCECRLARVPRRRCPCERRP